MKRWMLGMMLVALTGLAWAHRADVVETVRKFREPLRLGSPLSVEGRMISHALARNEARFLYSQDRGYARMRIVISGRLQETWRTPEGTFLYLEGLIRAPGTQERTASAQERLEQRLLTQLLLKPRGLQDAGDIRMPDGSPARWWITSVVLGNHEYSLNLYLHRSNASCAVIRCVPNTRSARRLWREWWCLAITSLFPTGGFPF